MDGPRSKSRTEELDPKALTKLINDRFGDGTLRKGSDPYFKIDRIPTGILSLDYMLGGGFPRGRHVECYGGYSVGKTLMSYMTIAQAQKMGLACAFVDAEKTFDPEFASHLGVNVEELSVHHQESGNRVIDLMETLLRAGNYGVIVLDSIASLLPKSEKEQDMERGSYGTAQAKLMSAALRRLTAANQSTVLMYINQLRDNIGVMFGPKSTTSGGRAMAFYASVRLEMTKTERIKKKSMVIDHKTGDEKEQEILVGHRVLVRLDKDKSGNMSGDTTSFVFRYDSTQVDRVEDLILLGRTSGLISKKGTRWSLEGYEDESQASRAKFHRWMGKNVAVQEELESKIWEGKDGE